MNARPLIIDCDPGQDDAIALLLAMASPDMFELVGITVVAGNVPLFRTEKNARCIRELAGRADIPVYAGCARPMVRPLETAEFIHGTTGIYGADLPEPRHRLEAIHAVDFLVDTLMAAPEPITLATLGPLTNLAVSIVKCPQIVGKIREIVTMGGSIALGNVTPAAEFNIYVDPHAAHVVFESGVPITMIGLDVTHQAIADAARVDAIRALGTPLAASVCGMLDVFAEKNAAAYQHGAPLHDPCVVAYLLAPKIFKGRDMRVDIELSEGHSTGRTICDVHGRGGKVSNVHVIEKIDVTAFFDLLTMRLGHLPLELK